MSKSNKPQPTQPTRQQPNTDQYRRSPTGDSQVNVNNDRRTNIETTYSVPSPAPRPPKKD